MQIKSIYNQYSSCSNYYFLAMLDLCFFYNKKILHSYKVTGHRCSVKAIIGLKLKN